MVWAERQKLAQKMFEERHPGLIKKRAHDRYMIRKGNKVAEEMALVEKEILETKEYIKKVWGRETPLKNISYSKMRKLGDELGMNIFNVKNFQDKYDEDKFKDYHRVCKYCGGTYKLKVKKKSHPINSGVCSGCMKKPYRDR